MSDGFLSRWSRRKRLVEAEQVAPPPVVTDAPEIAPPGGAGVAAENPGAEITPEELALLPAPESLTAETDITAFLRRGVPQALRDAALRRAWALDPMVRDFVCEAREYAYDWNVPGGVPGNGDILPTDDVAGMLRQIFGDGPPPAAEVALPSPRLGEPGHAAAGDVVSHSGEPPAQDGASEMASDEDAAQQDTTAHAPETAPDPSLADAETERETGFRRRDASAAMREPEPELVQVPAPPRRHGRATPV